MIDAKLYLAGLLAKGVKIPEDTYEIEVNNHEINFLSKEPVEGRWGPSRYINSIEIENEQIAYDTYMLEFSDREFTLEEFNEWLSANPGILEEQRVLKEAAVKRLAELSEVINKALLEGEALADKAGVPFNVKLGGSYQDVRKLAAVDWDSSSMFC